MTPPVVAFFNNKGGVGKTTLVYHLAWMAADLGYSVLAADLDPQANLTAACLDAEHVERLWDGKRQTIYGAISPARCLYRSPCADGRRQCHSTRPRFRLRPCITGARLRSVDQLVNSAAVTTG